MRVVHRACPPEEKLIQFTCDNCKSTLEARVSEGHKICDTRDGNYREFRCEVCKHKIRIAESVIYTLYVQMETPKENQWAKKSPYDASKQRLFCRTDH